MRAHEFISKLYEQNCVPGWQDPDITVLPNNFGRIILGKRLDQACLIVEIQILYYNEKINPDYDNDSYLVYGIRVKNNIIYEYDFQFNRVIKNVGQYQTYEETIKLFSQGISKYLNFNIGESMSNVKSPKLDLFELVPELENKIKRLLMSYESDFSKQQVKELNNNQKHNKDLEIKHSK